jgi:hypothetical protein
MDGKRADPTQSPRRLCLRRIEYERDPVDCDITRIPFGEDAHRDQEAGARVPHGIEPGKGLCPGVCIERTQESRRNPGFATFCKYRRDGTNRLRTATVFPEESSIVAVLPVVPKRLTENEMSDFSRLWHDGCVNESSRHKMWTEITRPKYERGGQRYASDLTDAEWALIEPHMPPSKALGRPRETALRAVLDAILSDIPRIPDRCETRIVPSGVLSNGKSRAAGAAGGQNRQLTAPRL